MPAAKQSLSHKALKLSPRKRMSLATLLLESMQEEPEVNPVLLAELKQRAADLRSGKVKGAFH